VVGRGGFVLIFLFVVISGYFRSGITVWLLLRRNVWVWLCESECLLTGLSTWCVEGAMLVVKSVPRAARAKSFFAALSVLLVIAATLFGANVASGDEVWHQSYQRGSLSEECVAQPGETPWQTSWGTDSSWKPSWEQWANNGQGGWVCSRSITWARDSAARVYNIGDTGPGEGLVFLISGGLTYEMAPKTWSRLFGDDTPSWAWCSDDSTSIAGAVGTAVGTGSANTTAMLALPCTSGAAFSADAYDGGGFTDWFLPSQDELNEMCNYSRNPTTPPTGVCTGSQDGTFSTGTYGFASDLYWSSSQRDVFFAWNQSLDDGYQGRAFKSDPLRVRPVRAF
jgi:hypothetical protein